MKRILLLMMIMVMAAITVKAETDYYRVDEAVVEQMFASAVHFDLNGVDDINAFTTIDASVAAKNPWVALALNTVAYFTGICGIHRLYLGTKTTTFVIYLCTGGGCGIVQAIDWVYLLIGALNEDIRKFENNDKFIMF